MITITIDNLNEELQADLEDYIRRFVSHHSPEGTTVAFAYPEPKDPVTLADDASSALSIVVATLKALPAEKREKVFNMARKLMG